MNNLIDKSNQLTSLLEELKQVTNAEKYKYVVKLEYQLGHDNVYSLYSNIDSKFIKYDKLDRLKSYFNLRNITESDVYYEK